MSSSIRESTLAETKFLFGPDFRIIYKFDKCEHEGCNHSVNNLQRFVCLRCEDTLVLCVRHGLKRDRTCINPLLCKSCGHRLSKPTHNNMGRAHVKGKIIESSIVGIEYLDQNSNTWICKNCNNCGAGFPSNNMHYFMWILCKTYICL
jgi:hypothetical protein